jgi:O-antigen/teichoic acid export membrane protein
MKKKSEIKFDILLNIIASSLITITNQLVIYPLLAKNYSNDSYGNLLTIIGIVNMVGVSFGAALNNTILINQEKNIKIIIKKYYVVYVISATLIIYSLIILLKISVSVSQLIIIILTSIFVMSRGILNVNYRIQLKYKKQLLSNIFYCLAMLIALFLFIKFKFNAILIYFIAEFTNTIYIAIDSRNIRGSYMQSVPSSNDTSRIKSQVNNFTITGLLSNLMIYLDRLIIYPMLGPENVSIYTIASVFGKTISAITVPISSVILSYISKSKKIDNGKVRKTIHYDFLIILFTFIIAIFASPVLTEYFYPKYSDEANKYYIIITIAIMLNVYSNLIQPYFIKLCTIKKLTIIQVVQIVIYFVFSLSLGNRLNLYYFSYISLFSNGAKAIYLYLNILNETRAKSYENT